MQTDHPERPNILRHAHKNKKQDCPTTNPDFRKTVFPYNPIWLLLYYLILGDRNSMEQKRNSMLISALEKTETESCSHTKQIGILLLCWQNVSFWVPVLGKKIVTFNVFVRFGVAM